MTWGGADERSRPLQSRSFGLLRSSLVEEKSRKLRGPLDLRELLGLRSVAYKTGPWIHFLVCFGHVQCRTTIGT